MALAAYFSRRAPRRERDPEVQNQINEQRKVLDRNYRLVDEIQGIERALREKQWTDKQRSS